MALPRPAQAQGTCQGSLSASSSAAPALAKFVPAAERSGVVFHAWLDPNRPAAHLVLENTNGYPVAVSYQAELRGAAGPVATGTRCVWIRAGEFVLDRPGVTVFEYPATLTAIRIASAQIAPLDPPRPVAPPVSLDTARPRAEPPRPARARPAGRRPAANPDSIRASRRARAMRDSVRASRRAAATRDSVRAVAARRDSAVEARRASAPKPDSTPQRRVTAVRPDSAPRRVMPDSARIIATKQPIPRDTSTSVAVFRDFAPATDTAAVSVEQNVERARALRAAGMLEESRAAYAGAVRARPSEPVLRAELGGVLLRLRRFAEAEQQFRAAVELDHSVPSYYAGLGAALEGSRRWAAAEAALRDAQRLAPADPAIRASLQRVIAAKTAVRTPPRREGPPPPANHAAAVFSVAAGALLVPAGAVLGIAVAGAAFLLGGLVPAGAVRRLTARLRRRG
jgi:Flp pilus assembly protein TadD